MLKTIDHKLCQNHRISWKPFDQESSILLSEKEIIYLAQLGEIKINKLQNQKKGVFEYQKPYLQFFPYGGLQQLSFVEGKTRSFLFCEYLEALEKKEYVFTREEVQKFFSYDDSYDGMYIIDLHGEVCFAKNTKDGSIIQNFSIPNNQEIALRKFQKDCDRIQKYYENFEEEEYNQKIKEVKIPEIQEIKNFPLFDLSLNYQKYSHLWIRIKNHHFDLLAFSIFLKQDNQFLVKTEPLRVKEYNIYDVAERMNEPSFKHMEKQKVLQRKTWT